MKQSIFLIASMLVSLCLSAQSPVLVPVKSSSGSVAFTADGSQMVVVGKSFFDSNISNKRLNIVSTDSFEAFSCPGFTPVTQLNSPDYYNQQLPKGNEKGLWAEINEKKITLKSATSKPVVLKGHKGSVSMVVFDPTGNRAFSTADGEPFTYVWNCATGELITKLSFRAITITFSNDRKLVVMNDKILNAIDLSILFEFNVYPSAVCAAFTADQRFVAISYAHDSRSEDSYVIIYDTSNGDEMAKLVNNNSTEWRLSLAFSPDGKYLAGTCNYCTTACVWDVSSFIK